MALGTERPRDLLGHAIDFTADAENDTALLCVARGVFGRYAGRFHLRLYYEQLKRYAEWENRDVWEYRLRVDPDDLDFLLMHVWELGGVDFPYWFFTKNCSYELLRLLDLAVVDLDSSRRFPGPVLPIDTVRAVAGRPDMVTDVRHRPSPEAILRARLRSLRRDDRRRVDIVVAGGLDPADESLARLSPQRRATVLDAAYDSLRYRYLAGQMSDEASRHLSREILLARSLVRGPGSSAETLMPQRVRPDLGHASSLLAFGGGWRDDEAFAELHLRPALHGLLDDDSGYPRHMQIRVLEMRARIYPDRDRVRLHELTLLELDSLRPGSHVAQPWAWSVATGLATRRVPDDGALEDAAVWRTQGGAGLAWDPLPEILVYGLPDMHVDVSPEVEDDVSAGPGGRVGALVGGHGGPWALHAFGRVTGFVLGEQTTWLEGGRVLASRLEPGGAATQPAAAQDAGLPFPSRSVQRQCCVDRLN